jgi:hypothetical protein
MLVLRFASHLSARAVHGKRNVVCQAKKTRKPEVFYQRILEKHLDGKHMRLDCGITDITTDLLHAEIKEWRKWKEAVGQLLSYNVCENRPYLRLYLFDSYPTPNKNIAIRIFQKYNIQPFEFIEDDKNMYLRDLVTGEDIPLRKK